MLEQRKLELNEYQQILKNMLNLFQSSQFEQLNHFYDAMYPISLQAKVKTDVPIKDQFFEWCEIEKFQKIENLSQQQLVTTLIRWHQQAPSLYSAYLLGQFWSNIASDSRGTDFAMHVSQSSWEHAEIAKDMAFYWLLKAIEIDSKCPWVYLSLLLMTGYLSLPHWFWNSNESFSLSHYSHESLVFLHQFGDFEPQGMDICHFLPFPSVEEKDYPLLYWLNRTLECDSQFMPVLRNYVYYLYPRWYGDEHHSIDAFLESQICQTLPKEKFNG